MKKIIVGLSVVLFVSISFLMACSGGKNTAEMAIKAADEAVSVTKAEAAKIVPDQVKSLEDALADTKEKFVKGEYKEALGEATALAGKAKAVLAAAKTKKEELTKKWTELSQGLPKMVEEIQGKVDSLSKIKKLPSSITKEGFEAAKAGLASVKDEWSKVQQVSTSGNFAEAVNGATSLKNKAVKIMEALEISVPAQDHIDTTVSASTGPTTSSDYEHNLTERCKDWIYYRNKAYKLGREGDQHGSEKARIAMQTFDRDLRKYFTDKQISDEISRLESSGYNLGF
jgi:hypothetical protein